jgi:hypothetical protein
MSTASDLAGEVDKGMVDLSGRVSLIAAGILWKLGAPLSDKFCTYWKTYTRLYRGNDHED